MKLLEVIENNGNLLSEGALTDLLKKVFGNQFSKSLAFEAEQSLGKSIGELVRGKKKITFSALRGTASYKDALSTTVAEAARVKYSKTFDELVKSNKNDAQKLVNDVQEGLQKELAEQAEKSGVAIADDVVNAQKNVTKTTKAVTTGKVTQIDLTTATKNLKTNTKLQTRYNDAIRSIQGMDKMSVTQVQNLLKKNVKTTISTGEELVQGGVKEGNSIMTGGKVFTISREGLKKFPGRIKRIIVNNPVLSILASLGLGSAALYYFFGGDDSDAILLTNENGEPLTDKQLSGWAPCIQELLKNKEAVIKTTSSGQVSAFVKSEEYPGGVQFYSNGRIMDMANKKMGSWKCKSGVTTIQEQGSEIDVNTMTKYVDDAVDDLDGYVNTGNLNSLLNILTSLQGKTFQGNDAVQEFLSLYKEDEGGDDFVNDVNSVGVKTLGTKGILAKREILKIISGGGLSPEPESSKKVGIGNIEITWDGEKTDDGKVTPDPIIKKPKFHDCSKKPLPHEFGCRSSQIKQVQICLGLPEKYQTGNFGPITKNAIEKLNIDLSNGLTQRVIDAICKGAEDNVGTRTPMKLEPLSPRTARNLNPISSDMTKLSVPNINPIDATPQQFYNAFRENGNLIGEDRNRRIKYKGPDLNSEQLDKLDTALSDMGYVRIKQKEEIKRYDSKYVWEKQ